MKRSSSSKRLKSLNIRSGSKANLSSAAQSKDSTHHFNRNGSRDSYERPKSKKQRVTKLNGSSSHFKQSKQSQELQISLENNVNQIVVTDEAELVNQPPPTVEPQSATTKKKASKSFNLAMQARHENLAKAYRGKKNAKDVPIEFDRKVSTKDETQSKRD